VTFILVMLDSSLEELQGALKIHVCIYICILLLIVCIKCEEISYCINCIVMCHVMKANAKIGEGQ